MEGSIQAGSTRKESNAALDIGIVVQPYVDVGGRITGVRGRRR